ncbi:sulfotransferase family protein [Candidatus Thiosymbion oneisti]|uniref:sulfotransferase family protein n=1 Tax=Candidatus Thiosymbion oneisti TaxID=589554 RepID=UPI00105D3A74|nr:sulfotransferase [Candidatus Thiosymbion oneisti]
MKPVVLMKGSRKLPSPLVNFMIIGAQKCGTTALARYLAEHPSVCMAWGKEVHLFDSLAPVGFAPQRLDRFYHGYFEHYRGEPIVGEATPSYLYFPEAIAGLHHYNPRLKLIVLLRDPLERALSAYAMERNRGRESWPVDPALCLEPVRRLAASVFRGSRTAHRTTFSYVDRSRYRRQLDTLGSYFPKEQILLLHAEALGRRYEETLRSVYAFLGISVPSPLPPPRRVRQTERKYRPSSLTLAWLRWVLRKERRWLRERFPNRSD